MFLIKQVSHDDMMTKVTKHKMPLLYDHSAITLA